jgi:hypothetical protein
MWSTANPISFPYCFDYVTYSNGREKEAEASPPFGLPKAHNFGTKYSGLYLHTRKRTTKVGKTLGNSKCFAYLCQYPNSSTLRYAERAAKQKPLE